MTSPAAAETTPTPPDLVSPIQPHEIPTKLRRGLEDIVRRVTARSAVDGRGSDLMLRVYLAGMYHGMALEAERHHG